MEDMTITLDQSKDLRVEDLREIFRKAVVILEEKGYDAKEQLVGYLMTGEPSYIPRHDNLRNEIKEIDRDLLLGLLVEDFLKDDE